MTDIFAAGASLALILTALVAWFRWLRPKVRKVKADVVAGRDALLGRDAIKDSITGKELVPKLPGVGERVASIEGHLSQLVNVGARLDSHEEWLNRLQRAADERQLARTESIELYRVIDNAIKSDPKKE